MEDFCGMYEIDEATFKSWNRKYNKMKNTDKLSLIEVPIGVGLAGSPEVFFEVETFDGNLFRFYREGNAEFIRQLIGL